MIHQSFNTGVGLQNDISSSDILTLVDGSKKKLWNLPANFA